MGKKKEGTAHKPNLSNGLQVLYLVTPRRVAKGGPSGIGPQSFPIDDRRLFRSYSVFVLQCSMPYCFKNTKFGQLILRKNIKIVATRCQF